MCGICGILNLRPSATIDVLIIRQMLEMIGHRGPDGMGIYLNPQVGLGNARLSIIDLDSGNQPISNENENLWIVFNGEIFNYVELRQMLEERGHQFTTNSDTETILHLYEDEGVKCLEQLNGEFAFAIWDNKNQSLLLARDRVGIRPIFYTIVNETLIFGSEIKAILAHPDVAAELDLEALSQVFTYWSVQAPSSIFNGIEQLPPGHFLMAKGGHFKVDAYWSLDFKKSDSEATEQECADRLEQLLTDAIRIRLRSDVPVGAYLSGGLDSSLVVALIQRFFPGKLETYSISFSDPRFDESAYQIQVSNFLGTKHHIVHCTYNDIGISFPSVVWHTETPILRTAPAPMFLLSKLVHDNGFKVVLTGEGADEFLAGYEIFKEMQWRRFWARDPDSTMRPMLLGKIYTDIPGLSDKKWVYSRDFFRKGLTDTNSLFYSHAIRWDNTSRAKRFLKVRATRSSSINSYITLPLHFAEWSGLSQAQYLEATTFLTPYLLSSQGDRMSMAHAVEGRYPFLDYRLIEYCNQLPDDLKLRGLNEKWLLKRLGAKYLPESVWTRRKKPYRAPIQNCFFPDAPLEYVSELLLSRNLEQSGYFDVHTVTTLAKKAASHHTLGEVDSMALVGIISTQLLHYMFIQNFQLKPVRSKVLKIVEQGSNRS